MLIWYFSTLIKKNSIVYIFSAAIIKTGKTVKRCFNKYLNHIRIEYDEIVDYVRVVKFVLLFLFTFYNVRFCQCSVLSWNR